MRTGDALSREVTFGGTGMSLLEHPTVAPRAREEVLAIRTELHGAKDWHVTDARLALAYTDKLSFTEKIVSSVGSHCKRQGRGESRGGEVTRCRALHWRRFCIYPLAEECGGNRGASGRKRGQ